MQKCKPAMMGRICEIGWPEKSLVEPHPVNMAVRDPVFERLLVVVHSMFTAALGAAKALGHQLEQRRVKLTFAVHLRRVLGEEVEKVRVVRHKHTLQFFRRPSGLCPESCVETLFLTWRLRDRLSSGQISLNPRYVLHDKANEGRRGSQSDACRATYPQFPTL